MKIIRKIEFSKWFILIMIIWLITFTLLGIKSGQGAKPSADSNNLLDTIYIIGSFTILPFLFYFLYKNINQYLIFLITPFLGMTMEWFLFRPSEILNQSSTAQALAFFAIIWMVILIPPYYLTLISQKSRRYFYSVLIVEILFFIGAIVNLTIL